MNLTLTHSFAARVVIALALAAVLATSLSPLVRAQDDDDATPSTAACDVEAAIADAPAVFEVDVELSTASYTSEEVLAGIGANTAVGTTNAIIGYVLFDGDGSPLPCSAFAVDMRTLVSDSSRRDNFLRQSTLQSNTYPYTIFVIAAVEGLEGPLVEGETYEVELIGDLTIRDVTRSTVWTAEFTLDDGVLTGTASHTFNVNDFNIQKPLVASVVSIEDDIVLSINIVARPMVQAAG